MTGRRQAELARRGGVEQPARQPAPRHDVACCGRQAFAVEGPAAQAARAVRFVADQDGTVEELFFFLAEQEAGSPRGRGAADRAEQVTEQAGTDARVEDEGPLADRRLAGGEAVG